MVSDDSSSPDGSELVRQLGEGVVGHVHHEADGDGMTNNWNRAIAQGSAPTVLLLGQDDALEPAALAELYAVLDAHPDVSAVGCGRTFINDVGEPLSPRLRVNDRSRIFLTPGPHRLDRHELTMLCLRNGNPFGEPSAVLFRRAAYDAVGGFDPSYRQAVDVAFLLRIVSQGDVIYLPQALLRRRRHPGSQTSSNVRSGASSEERVRLIDEFGAAAGLSDDEISRCLSAAFVHCGFDFARAARHRWPAARVNARLLGRLVRGGARPRHVAATLMEVATSRNQDRR